MDPSFLIDTKIILGFLLNSFLLNIYQLLKLFLFDLSQVFY
jgi:hypothetical protein